MIIVDANILIYAVNNDAPQQDRCRSWLAGELASGRPVGLPWTCLLAFVRVTTHRRLFATPLDSAQAMGIVGSWLDLPNVTAPEPGGRHFRILRELLEGAGTAGNLTNDAYLAALALEFGGKIATLDRDFARFDVPLVIPPQPA
ncbi:TA system VapC family ribonuclease toxin [Gordonia sp. CPCC 205333]|uniref:TA system VapC family ribonuclease toxin n=1 Tax=Gordonia sp. CPCC 205333 TaxID=3140790 RepID=UPI003AF3A093